MRLITPRIRMTIVLLAIVMLVYWLGAALQSRSVPTREAAELESRTSICESLAVTSSLLIQESKSPLPQDYISQLMDRNPKFRSIGVRDRTGKLVASTPNHKSVWADPDLSDKDRFQPGLFSGNRRWGQIEFTFKAKTPVGISSDLFRPIFLLCGTAFGFMLYLGRKLNATRPPESVPNEARSALDLLGGGLMVLNKSGQIVNANEAFALSCGSNVKDVVGKHPEKVSRWLAGDGTPLKNPPWEHTFKTGERVYEDVVGMVVTDNSTGTEDTLTFKVNCSPVKSHLSNDNCVLVSLANVTELAKSKLAAEDTNTAKSDCMANMSHEIRTPISDIADHSQIEAEDIGDGKQTEKVSTETNTKQQLEHKSQAKEPKQPELTGGTVLVVDDGEENRNMIKLVLTRAGFVVTEAVNGKIGSDLALERDFDLILMDMRMPVMDGYKATGRLRENGYEGPIMALTANAMSGDREICLAVGCNDFLAKPVNIDLLLESVAKYVSPQVQPQQSSNPAVIKANESIAAPIKPNTELDPSQIKAIAIDQEPVQTKESVQANEPVEAQQTQETAAFAAGSNLVENQTSQSVEVGCVDDQSTIDLADFEYLFAENLGEIENAIHEGKSENLVNLAKFIQDEASKRSLDTISLASKDLIAACEALPLNLDNVNRQVSKLDAISNELFHEYISEDSTAVNYSDLSRKRLSHFQRGWQQNNFRLMRIAFEKLQCDSYATGRTAIGDALVGLIKCCDERDNVALNTKLTPFLKIIQPEMTATGRNDGAESQVAQEQVTGKLKSQTANPEVNAAHPKRPDVNLEIDRESSDIVSPIYSSLPDGDDFREIVLGFIPQMETSLREMESALSRESFDELAKLAHWLKGSGGTCGFNDLFAPSSELEIAAKAKDREACQICFDLLITLTQRIAVRKVKVQ